MNAFKEIVRVAARFMADSQTISSRSTIGKKE